MHAFIQKLLASGPILTDGAWGTQLQEKGLSSEECPDCWNLSHPDRVCQVARAYVDAGSQVILTNTFGANRLRMAGFNLAGQVHAINEAGVKISREAAGGRAYVFASMGPTGKLLMLGDATEEEFRSTFSEQAAALAAGGPDALVVETMADLPEAKSAVAAAHETGLPVVACMVFDSGKNKDRTMMGVLPEQAAEELLKAGADVIGANCGQGIAGYVNVCQRLRMATQAPIWIKANAGLPEIVNGQAIYKTTPAEFASYVPALIQAGANFIGGCCGTSPDFIRAVKDKLGRC